MLIVATVSAAMVTRRHGVMTGMRHLGAMLVPAVSYLAARGRFRGWRTMMVVMVFHVALMCW